MIASVSMLVAAFVALAPASSPVREVKALEIVGAAHAQGMIVIRITVEELVDGGVVYLDLQAPGEKGYCPVDVYKTDCPALSSERFVDAGDDKYTVVVPLFGRFAKNPDALRTLFPVAGVYRFRVRYYSKVGVYPPRQPSVFTADVSLGPPIDADVEYFELACRPTIWRLLGLRDEEAERLCKSNRTALGLLLMEKIMGTVGAIDPVHGEPGWGNTLYDLVWRIRESSYAPHLAYYAACSMLEQKGNKRYIKSHYGFDVPDRRLNELDFFQKATAAMEFSMEKGDTFIKPLAMCYLAILRAWKEDIGGADALVARVRGNLVNRQQIRVLLDKTNEDVARLKVCVNAKQREGENAAEE